MKVILLQEVRKLGPRGAVVEVADGYARNYLFPRKLASPVTEGKLAQMRKEKEEAAARERRELEQARKWARRLQEESVVVRARAGEGGKLFGSVTAQDIATALEQLCRGLEVDRRKLKLTDPIKSLGEHRVTFKIHPRVTAEVRVVVEPGDTP